MESALAEEIMYTNLQFKDPYSNYTTFDTYNIKSSNKINKIDTSQFNIDYSDIDLDKIQPNEKILIKLPKDQVNKIKLLEKKHKLVQGEELSDDEEELPELEEDSEVEDLPKELSINEYIKDIECKHKKNEVREIDLNSLFKNKLYESYFDIDLDKSCSFELILFIIKHHNPKLFYMNINELKNILIDEYFNHEYTETLIHTMLNINKKLYKEDSAGNNLIQKLKISPFLKIEEFKKLLSDIINSPLFFVTYVDIYLIVKKYNLPIIIVCNTIINLSITDKTFIILNNNTQNNNYYFIKIPSTYIKTHKNYKLLHFNTSSTIDITKDIIDTNKVNLYSDILLQLEEYTDVILNYIIISHQKKVVPKDTKLTKKLKK